MRVKHFRRHERWPDFLVLDYEKEIENLRGLAIQLIYELNVCTKWGCNTRYIPESSLESYKMASKTGYLEYDILGVYNGIILV